VKAGLKSVFVRRGPWAEVHVHWPEAALAHLQVEDLAVLPEAIGVLS
jgi:hypothetical protein